MRILIVLISLVLSGCSLQPVIEVSGVENGKMYATDVMIEIDEELAGNYTMQLDGEPIQSGYNVTNNGKYELKVSAKKWWLEDLKTITFDIDLNPPNTPSFETEPLDAYFQEALFQLEKEDRVSYEVILNGNPYDLKKPIIDEGQYELKVVANKENGLKSTNSISFMVDNTSYSKEVVDRFVEFMLTDEEAVVDILWKWNNDVEVVLHGDPTNMDVEMVKQSIMEVNDLLPIELQLVDKVTSVFNNKIDIYFVPTSQFSKYGYDGPIVQGDIRYEGFAFITDIEVYGEISETIILIGTDTTQESRKTTILHEIVHSLGLYNHFEEDNTSIFYPYNDTGVTTLSEKDRILIELLYRYELKPGVRVNDISKLLESRIEAP
ncbi:DUF2927 domain-containing protein [Bacillus sp. 2205SS5-2]|uniref:DUF2927 domain-containing protein n=1 Tax=Bacillus sp. 2205SS5-2 TaxID=3109031 RepID=UPI0030061206